MEMLLKETSEILGLRETGARLRKIIEAALHNDEEILIDFDSVESVSSSFADEFIACLFIKMGQDDFIRKIKLKNVNEFIRTVINATIKDRKKELSNQLV